ncbi:MAG: hypothetical protein J6C85_05515 [Alphaproteobacteria bacterium]|nr:hypothetical protein [Alphaproteobacteria bacterium]
MKKYLLFLSCSLFAATSAEALSAKDQLAAMKELFVKEFEKIDTNANGVIDKDEYLAFQYENFRANVIEADGFDHPAAKTPQPLAVDTPAPVVKQEPESLAGISPALQEMADFDLDLDEPLAAKEETNTLATEDFLLQDDAPKKAEDTSEDTSSDFPELDLTLSEEESLDNIIKDMEQKENPVIEDTTPKKDPVAQEKRITYLLENIKKTLPKKIDDITTWTDITYDNNTIAYIYQADVDTTSFSTEEKAALKSSIENEACVNAYYEMCPKIKPFFIDEGISVKISYQDKTGTEINSCNFNNDTCK